MTADVLFKRLSTACNRRVALRKITNALRLVNGAGDSLPGLVIEHYNKHFCVQVFDRPWLSQIELVHKFLSSHFDVGYLILKDRTTSIASTPDAFKVQVVVPGDGAGTVVTEHGVRFQVNLNDTLNTGLFLDMRANRHLLAGMARGKSMLNTFAYTCSFGVHAHSAGALEVVNVDVSKKILERGKDNYALNGLTPAPGEFVRADALDFCTRLNKRKIKFDMLVIDPPSFARHDNKTFQVKKDMPRLVNAATAVLKPGGTLFVATNCSALAYADLVKYVKMASVANRLKIKNMRPLGQDQDFTGSGTMKESHLAAVLVQFN